MDEVISILANEGVKSLLSKEIKIPIRMLEASLNELKKEFREKSKEFDRVTEGLQEELAAANLLIKEMKEAKSRLERDIRGCKLEFASAATTTSVDEKIKSLNLEIATALSQISARVQHAIIKCADHDEKFEALEIKERLFESEIEKVYEILDKKEKQFNKYRFSDADSSEKMDQAYAYLSLKTDDINATVNSHIEEQEKRVAKIESLSIKSEKTIKKNSLVMADLFNKNLSNFKNEFEEEMATHIAEKVKIRDKIYELEQQYIMAIKDKKNDKDLDDFMRQVSFNARQIAKINEMLEKK
jgi:hypothetical protein